MDAAAAWARIACMKANFAAIAVLALTAYMFPKQANLNEEFQSNIPCFDYIVVGGGSAGAVVAGRLAEAQLHVLLVEAGPVPPLESVTPGLLTYLQNSRYDWYYTHEEEGYCRECKLNKTLHVSFGRVLGGSSSINHMFYIRGCPGDFIPWEAAAKSSTWNWNEILPFFIKSENLQDEEVINSPQGKFHGTKGFLGVTRQSTDPAKDIIDSFAEIGHDKVLDINADKHLGYGQIMFTIRDGVRQSTAYTILGEQKNNPYLHVLTETFVTKIVLDENNNAIGMEATTKDNKQIEVRARKEIIVSAGALNTPHLLMVSGIGPQEHLESFNIPVRSNLPVGMNLQDHLLVMVATKLEKSNEPPAIPDPRTYIDTVAGHVALNKSNSCPDYLTINLIIPNESDAGVNICSSTFEYNHDICQHVFDAVQGRNMLSGFIMNVHPKSRGSVRLQSNDPCIPPLVDAGYLSDPRDLEKMVDILMDYVKVYDSQHFRNINAEMVDFNLPMCISLEYWSRDWWRCYVKCMWTSSFHFAGSCSLGSVVDSHLRVFGVGRLRVADNSIVPELISAGTNPVAIMIGEKAAEFIIQDHNYI